VSFSPVLCGVASVNEFPILFHHVRVSLHNPSQMVFFEIEASITISTAKKLEIHRQLDRQLLACIYGKPDDGNSVV